MLKVLTNNILRKSLFGLVLFCVLFMNVGNVMAEDPNRKLTPEEQCRTLGTALTNAMRENIQLAQTNKDNADKSREKATTSDDKNWWNLNIQAAQKVLDFLTKANTPTGIFKVFNEECSKKGDWDYGDAVGGVVNYIDDKLPMVDVDNDAQRNSVKFYLYGEGDYEKLKDTPNNYLEPVYIIRKTFYSLSISQTGFTTDSVAGIFGGGNLPKTTKELTDEIKQAEVAASPKTNPCEDVGTWWLLGADAIGCNVIYFLFGLVLKIFYFCADLMIQLFAKVVDDYILNISEWFNPGDNIYTIWSSVRDITNILVLFSAIFIGLRRILGDDIDFTKNILKVFIFALLVNFSYPISRFFIDISNVIALFIYNSINGSQSGIATLAGNLSQTDKIAAAVAKGSNAAIDVWGATFMAILFMLAIFITFAVISIMILIRVFILILSVIFSPLMFAAGFLGVLDEWHNKWKDNYFGMLLYPPLLMLGLFVTFSILNSILKINPADINTSGDTASVTIKLVMSLAALLITTITANKFSGSLGKAISGKATGMAKTLALGGGALAVGLGLRSGLGAAAGKIKGSKWVQDKKENGGFVTRNVAGLLNSGANKVQNTRFKIGNYGVSDTYKDKLEEKKSVLDNKLAYLDRTDPEKALRAREALRTRGNTVGDIKNIGKIINDDPNYLAQVNNEKAALDTKAKNVSTNTPDKVVGDEDIKGQRDEAAARIRALRQKRSAAGYGIDTGYSPSNNSNRNSGANNNKGQQVAEDIRRETSAERVFNDGEILEDNKREKREKTEQLKQAIRDRINNGDNTQTQGFKNLVTAENRIDQDRIEAEIDAKNKIENGKAENERQKSSVIDTTTDLSQYLRGRNS